MTVVAVVGLGYVGLPLAVEFGKKHPTVGFDLSERKVAAYRRFVDPTEELSEAELKAASYLRVTTQAADLVEADFVVVAVPTPVDQAHQPDFGPLLGASEAVGKNLKRGATVVFESTVYPGATEEICVPVIERCSGLKWRRDFFVGYSPERINPGDREHSLTRITKVVSGLLQNDKTKDLGLKLFKKAWEAFPQNRGYLLGRLYDDAIWRLPEIYSYAREAVIPREDSEVDPWQSAAEILSYGGDGRVDGVITRMLTIARRQQRVAVRRPFPAAVPAPTGDPDRVGRGVCV